MNPISIDVTIHQLPEEIDSSVEGLLWLVGLVESSFKDRPIKRNDPRTPAKYYFTAKGRVKRAVVFAEVNTTSEEIRVSILHPIRMRLTMESPESTRRVALAFGGLLSLAGADFTYMEQDMVTGDIAGGGVESPAEFLWRVQGSAALDLAGVVL